MLQEEDAETFPQALGFESLDHFSESASRAHVSQPWRRMEVTRDLRSLNLLAKLKALHRQILFSLAITFIAGAILMRISAEQVPFYKAAPRYLKLIISSNFWPFMLTSVLISFMLMVMILLFSVLTSFPYAVALSTRQLVRS